MTDLLIPIGAHLFSAAALQQYADAAAQQIAPGKTSIVTYGFDAAGAKVAIVLSVDAPKAVVKVQFAYAHDWSGDDQFGVGGSVSF